MTDELALDSAITPDSSAQPDQQAQAAQQEEEMLSKSRVEELVKKAKLKGRDSMQAELDALKAENEQLKSNSAGSMGGMAVPQVDPNIIAQQVMATVKQQMQQESEQQAKAQMQAEANRIVESYKSKMASGKDAYEDFDDVMADFNPQAFPNLVLLADQMGNTQDVMYELMKNPAKFGTIAVLSERDPAAAQRMLQRVSQSIQANQQAKAEQKDVPAPINRLSSSKTGQDSGKLTIRDYKKMYRV
jgi:hypothetical protein